MVAWPPKAPALVAGPCRSNVVVIRTPLFPQVPRSTLGVPDAMFEKTQVFAAVSHALVVLSTKLLAGLARAATVAVGVTAPPVQATTGVVPVAKNPEGKLMVMALAVLTVYGVCRVKTTVTALPPGAAAAAAPGTL